MSFRHHLLFIIIFFISTEICFSDRVLKLRVFPAGYRVISGENEILPEYAEGDFNCYRLSDNSESVFIRAEGFRDKYIFIGEDADSSTDDGAFSFEMKLERVNSPVEFLDEIPTGSQPKSVEFSPDGRYMAVALLNGPGVEIYSADNLELVSRLYLKPEWADLKGFVETCFLKTKPELWVSQMTTGLVHVFSTDTWSYLKSFSTGGSWPKVIQFNRAETLAFVSNWTSRDISIIDTDTGRLLSRVSVNGIPRGMTVSSDQKYLYVSNYSSGDINKIDLATRKVVKNIDLGDGALRHIVISPDGLNLYVSDMYYGKVFVMSTNTDRVVRSFYAGSNLNTIKISNDGSVLYISSRGRNSADGYLNKGPEFGKIFFYDTKNRELSWIWGGNQPTGLALSPGGDMLAFTDFLDHKMEIYRIRK